MGKFTVIPKETFDDLQLDAGVVLTTFDPSAPAVADSAIVCATTGGITVSCVPTYSDLGEDVDNCPNNLKELKHLESWECKMSFSALGTSPKMIRMALGAADIDGTDTTKVIPRRDLKQSDFTDLWWVGDKADGRPVYFRILSEDHEEWKRTDQCGVYRPRVHRGSEYYAYGVLLHNGKQIIRRSNEDFRY